MAKQKILARWVYEGYPDQDLLPTAPPRKRETVEQWIERCPEVVESIGDGLFSFLLREIVEGGEGEVGHGIHVLERARDDVQAVIEHIFEEYSKACFRKKPGRKSRPKSRPAARRSKAAATTRTRSGGRKS